VPVELKSVEEFIEVTGRALECRVKKSKGDSDIVKLKARTRRVLYTIKVPADKVEEILSKVKCPKIVFVDEDRVEERGKESSK